MQWGWISAATTISFQVLFIIRVLLRPHRQPASRVAWVRWTRPFGQFCGLDKLYPVVVMPPF
ncbi:hypothetical protein BFX83_14465 [Komagataeibacter xylinus]|nr:hypothetical protein BFX83_14465 [Komagataeibacter xylinus]